MASVKIEINPAYARHRDALLSIPDEFNAGGTIVFSGRNCIKAIDLDDGTAVAVKRYKSLDLFKGLIYTLLRPSKARRSFDNSRQLRSRGFDAPEEVAYIEVRREGVIRECYYVCRYTPTTDIRHELIENPAPEQELVDRYAAFVARLHESGVLHRDLNPGNVLYFPQEQRFSLIDINRMRFYDGAVPKAECMENLTLFWRPTEIYRRVLSAYARCRGWSDADIEEAMRFKYRHDRAWDRRKALTSIFKRKK